MWETSLLVQLVIFCDYPDCKFYVCDYFENPLKEKFDVVLASGVLNSNVKDNTPPATGSGPSSQEANVNEGAEGKTGPDRSTAILNNLLKGRK